MKYTDYDIVFQEVPDETTLALTISNCPYRCVGCHSAQLRYDIGEVLTHERLDNLIARYSEVTCVCLMGGDADYADVRDIMLHLRHTYPTLHTAWYSGRGHLPQKDHNLFDYIKIGPYRKDKGPLKSPATNQRMYRLHDGHIEDITYKFWKK